MDIAPRPPKRDRLKGKPVRQGVGTDAHDRGLVGLGAPEILCCFQNSGVILLHFITQELSSMTKEKDDRCTAHLHIKMPPDLLETLTKQAKKDGRTVSAYARLILKRAADDR